MHHLTKFVLSWTSWTPKLFEPFDPVYPHGPDHWWNLRPYNYSLTYIYSGVYGTVLVLLEATAFPTGISK